jgi:rhamnosyltransferase
MQVFHAMSGIGAGGNMADPICIIVCYRPDVPQLRGLCERILADGAKAILVDNTEQPYLAADALPPECSLTTLGYNAGIAHAQNVGIAQALNAAAAVLVFFDQDSKIEPGFLRTLVAPLRSGVAEIAAPLYVDADSGKALPSLRINRFGLKTFIHSSDSMLPYPVDIVISSGTAATKEVFEVAGGLDEALFIDAVDTEWCLRCRSRQVPIYVVPSAVMRQRIGTRSIHLGRFTILVHGPARCYYQLRNCFHLLRKKHVPLAFALTHMASVIFNRTLLLFFVEDRPAYIGAYISALRDGIRGVAGAKPA